MYRFKVGDRVNYGGCEQVLEYRGLFKGEHMAEHVEDTGNGMPFSHIPTKYTGLYWTIHEDETWTKIEGEDTPKPKFKVRPEQKFSVGDRVEVFGRRELNFTCKEGIIVSKSGVEDCWNVKAISGKSDTTDDENWVYEGDMRLVEEGCNSCEVEDRGTSLPKDFGVLRTGLIGELGGYEYYNNEPSNSSGNKVGKIMSKLGNFVKNSLLSADEKLLRKNGLKDSCGDYTEEAEELVIAKLIKDNEAYLIEVATAMEVEEKKNK